MTAAAAGPSILPMLLMLLLVLAMIPVALWLMRRLGLGKPAGMAGLRLVTQLSVGQRERVVIVEAGDRWWLLGVSAAGVNRLGTMPRGTLPAEALASAAGLSAAGLSTAAHTDASRGFAALLQSAIQRVKPRG
jgi:flagellar protein FliO/FliZ